MYYAFDFRTYDLLGMATHEAGIKRICAEHEAKGRCVAWLGW